MTTPLNPPHQSGQRYTNYQDALAAAAAIHSGALAVPGVNAVVLRTAEQTIRTRERASVWAKAAISRLWTAVNPYSDASVAQFAAQAAAVMGSAQTAAARAAAAAQGQQLQAMGIQVTPVPSNPLDVRGPQPVIENGQVRIVPRVLMVDYANDDVAHVHPDEYTTEGIFSRPAETFRYAKSLDVSPEEANSAALERVNSLVDDNLMLAQRIAEAEALAQGTDSGYVDKRGRPIKSFDQTVIGMRRVIHPELSRTGTCGLCIAAADRLYHIGALLPIHERCKCTVAAVTADFDPADHLNGIDLSTLYGHGGGTSASHLKRTRYQVDEHGELGPVLVPKKPSKPRSGKPYQSSGSRSR